MEKKINVKLVLILLSLTIVIGLSIAFATLSKRLKVEGDASVDPVNFDIHFKNLSEPEIKGGASIVQTPSISEKGVSIDNLRVNLTLPGDSVTYTVDIENSGDINSEISLIEEPILTNEQQELFEFKAYYTDTNEELKLEDELGPSEVKNVTIKIKYKDIEDPNLLPKTTQTINLSYKVTYVQSNKSFYTESGLPRTYTPLEYLESTGTQYLKINVTPSNIEKIYIKAEFIELPANYGFYGVHLGRSGQHWYDLLYSKTNQTLAFYAFETKSSNSIQIQNNEMIDINCETNYPNASINIGNQSYSFSGSKTNSVNSQVGLFAVLYNNTTYKIPKSRVYKYTHYSNDIIDVNLIPALDSNGRPCMYDTVTNTPFYNAGTGEFEYVLKNTD